MSDRTSQKQIRKSVVDGTARNKKSWIRLHCSSSDVKDMSEERKKNNAASSTLFSRGNITRTFFTEDSHRYMTPIEQSALLRGVRRYERTGHFDSVQMRYSRPVCSASEIFYRRLQQQYSSVSDTFRYLPDMISAHISPARVWNASIVGAIFFGMFSMTLIYRYLGQQVSAEDIAMMTTSPVANEMRAAGDFATPAVLGATDEKTIPEDSVGGTSVKSAKNAEQERFNATATEMVKGYPIEAMLPYILKQDKDVATFLISIAKKESNWGKRVPVLNGKDCYNYWGYRGVRDKMGTGGHTCFESPEDAVNTVAKRIKTLVQGKNLNTPAKMIIWKCGSSCTGHGSEDVRKWISDVDMYVQKLK
jgi:hypothetical protein